MHIETPAEYDISNAPAERPVSASKTVVSALRRALGAARNRQKTAAAQAANIERILAELTGGNGRDTDDE
jgi:hypothetical protein